MDFPKEKRLRKSKEYHRLRKTAKRSVGEFLCIDWRLTSAPMAKLGITASGHYGNAVHRNRFKRLAREAFRTAPLPPGLELNLVPRQRAKMATMAEIQKELLALCRSMRL